MTELEELLTKYNFPKRITKASTAFDEIEQRIGFPHPDDYKFYLENYAAYEEFVGPELVNLWDLDEILSANKHTGIFENLPLTLGIGNSPASEFIGIEYLGDIKCRIVLSPLTDLDIQYHTDASDSFTDFFIRLDNGKEWFD